MPQNFRMSFLGMNMSFLDLVVVFQSNLCYYNKGVIVLSEPNIRKEIRFPEISNDPIRMFMIGYNDFRYIDGWQNYRAYSWTALHYVRSGCGILFIKGKRYDIKAGDLFLIPANESIMYYPNESDPWRYYWINFHTDSQIRIEERIGLNSENPVKSSSIPHELCNTFDDLFEADEFSTKLYYKTLAAIIKILSSDGEPIDSFNSGNGRKPSVVDDALQIIQLNSSRAEFSVSDLPKMLFVSQRHLGKLFKERTGLTPVAYLSEMRLNHAAELLNDSDYTVAELCRKVGFGDEIYFMKQFKKKFKLTVKEYKLRIKQMPTKNNF